MRKPMSAEVVRLFAGENPDDLAFVRAHARRRAEQRFPLEATLHAYRCGHRAISRWLRDAAASACPQIAHQAVDAIADFAIEYTNVISAVMTSDYVAHTRLIEAAEGDRGAELLNILLAGYDESDGRIGRLLKSAGYLDQRQSYCVVGVRTPIAVELDNPERAQRLLAALANLFAPTNIKVLAGLRNSRVDRGRVGAAPAVGLDGAADEPGRAPGAASDATRPFGPRRRQRRSPLDRLDPRGLEGGDGGAGFRQRRPACRLLLRAAGAQPAAARRRRIRAFGRARPGSPALIAADEKAGGTLVQTLAGARRRRPQHPEGRPAARGPSQYDLCAAAAHPRRDRPRRPASPRSGRTAARRRMRADLSKGLRVIPAYAGIQTRARTAALLDPRVRRG